MSYTLIKREGRVVRNSDGFQILPCDSTSAPEVQEYFNWVQMGNEPTIDDSPSQEEIFKQLKAERAIEVSQIVVTTSNGWQFDGDEISQDRMARAIVGLNEGETIIWILHDNQVVMATKEILQEALRLAGAAMTAIWIRPYQ